MHINKLMILLAFKNIYRTNNMTQADNTIKDHSFNYLFAFFSFKNRF